MTPLLDHARRRLGAWALATLCIGLACAAGPVAAASPPPDGPGSADSRGGVDPRAADLQPLPQAEWRGLWRGVTDGGAIDVGYYVLLGDGRFYHPYVTFEGCEDGDLQPYDFAGRWEATPEGARFFIEVEQVLKRATCACDPDHARPCDVRFEEDAVTRAPSPDARKVIDARFIGYADGDEVSLTPAGGEAAPTAEILGLRYARLPQEGAGDVAASLARAATQLGGDPRRIHPDILAFFGCVLARDEVTCEAP